MLLVLHIFSSELPGSPNPLCSLLFPAVYPGRMTMMCPSIAFLAFWLLVGLSQWGALWEITVGLLCMGWLPFGSQGPQLLPGGPYPMCAGSLGSFIFYLLPISLGTVAMWGVMSCCYYSPGTGPASLLLVHVSKPLLHTCKDAFYLTPFNCPSVP